MIEKENNNLAILIVSCDKYADIWEPFFKIFFKEWEDIPFKIYLGSNYKKYEDKRVTNISIGEDRAWCENLEKMIKNIEEDNIMFILEDFFLTNKVNTSEIEKAFEYFKKNNIDCLKLCPDRYHKSKKIIGSIENIVIKDLEPYTPYRINTAVCIWKKYFLMALCIPGLSAWDFETVNSELINYFDCKIYYLEPPILYFKHAVEKGRWLEQGMNNLKKNNILVEYGERGLYDPEMKTEEEKNVIKNLIRNYSVFLPIRKLRLKIIRKRQMKLLENRFDSLYKQIKQ